MYPLWGEYHLKKMAIQLRFMLLCLLRIPLIFQEPRPLRKFVLSLLDSLMSAELLDQSIKILWKTMS